MRDRQIRSRLSSGPRPAHRHRSARAVLAVLALATTTGLGGVLVTPAAAAAPPGAMPAVATPAGTTRSATTAKKPLTTTVTTLGRARVGQPVATFARALGRRPGPITPSGNDTCWIRTIVGLRDVTVMVLNKPASAVRRVDIHTTTIKTTRGVGVGSTRAQVLAAYRGKVTTSPHKYVPGGQYLTVRSGKYALLFETDEKGRVTTYRFGEAEPVSWVEGCS